MLDVGGSFLKLGCKFNFNTTKFKKLHYGKVGKREFLLMLFLEEEDINPIDKLLLQMKCLLSFVDLRTWSSNAT